MNYLAAALFNDNPQYWEAYRLSLASYRKYLAGEWEPSLIAGDYGGEMNPSGWAKMHIDVLTRIRQMNESGHNVLYAEVDTCCIKPVRIFGFTKAMRMFWKTCCPHPSFEPYMNSGVIYFPATTPKECWEVCRKQIEKYNECVWDNFQVVTNAMFHAQKPLPGFLPALNWSPYVRNPLAREKARILHIHSSRGIGATLEGLRLAS